MTMSFQHSKLTAIVAVIGDGAQITQCLNALRWIPSVWVVSASENHQLQIKAENMNARFLVFDKGNAGTLSLWEQAVKSADSPWLVLLRSNETVTGSLRKTILETMETSPDRPAQFILPRTTVYLQKRLKRPLESRREPRSALAYQPKKIESLRRLPVKKRDFEGELIHYGAETLADAWADWNRKAQEHAERLAPELRNASTLGMLCKLIPDLTATALDALVKQKSFKEGFEGAVWTLAELAAAFGAYLQYHEKYLRRGQWLKQDLGALQNILVIKLRDIGDNILLSALFSNLKKAAPQASINVLTYEYSKSVFDHNPHIDEIYGLSKQASQNEVNEIIQQLNGKKFDLTINTHSGGLSTRILGKLNSPHKLNNHYIGRNKNYNVVVPQFEHYRSSSERDLDCLRAMGIEPETSRPEIHLHPDEIDWAEKELAARGFDPEKKLILIHPTAAVEIRAWGMDKFGELIKLLEKEERFNIAVICSPSEFSKASILLEQSPKLRIIHETTVRQMMAIVHFADLVVDNDSSPSHVSAAFGIPSIVLFSQAVREIFRPYDEKTDKQYVFYKDVDCRECGLTICENRICMEFAPEDVYQKCLEMLE